MRNFAQLLGLIMAVASMRFGQRAAAEPVLQMLHEVFPETGSQVYPYPNLKLEEGSDGYFYGAMSEDSGFGTVYRLSRDGTVTNFFRFAGTNGQKPFGGVTFGSDGNLYGTTEGGSTYATFNGSAFRVTTNGDLSTLLSFNGANGALPCDHLVKGQDGAFYSTTSGPSSKGTIFRMTEDGSLTTLHFFNGNDGANPCLFSLVQAESGTFFGVAFFGGLTSSSVPPGTLGRGTIFQITSNGVFTLLVRFDGTNGSNPVGLTFGPDGNLYGACNLGGDFDQGTVFRMTTNGILTTLISFDGTKGANPYGPLTWGRDGWMYGTTTFRAGGTNSDYGTIFKISLEGSFKTVALFDGTNGLHTMGAMTLSRDGNLYGVISDYMKKPSLDGNTGAFFRLVEPPIIRSIECNTAGVVLRWDSFVGAAYRIEYSSGMQADWVTVANGIVSTSSNMSFTIPSPSAATGNYRVALLP